MLTNKEYLERCKEFRSYCLNRGILDFVVVPHLNGIQEYRWIHCVNSTFGLIQSDGESLIYNWVTKATDKEVTFVNIGANQVGWWTTLYRIILFYYIIKPRSIIIPGYVRRYCQLFIALALIFNTPVSTTFISNSWDVPRKKYLELFKSFILKAFDGFFVGGKSHAAYLRSLGVSSNSIFSGYNVIDESKFSSAIRKGEPVKLKDIDKYFLSVGRFVWQKNYIRLLEAYSQYCQSVKTPILLVLVGYGPLKYEILNKISVLNISERVVLVENVSYEDISWYYKKALCLVLPSVSEPWGLVVNEALAAEVPVIVSDKCGCVADLVIENYNGFIIDPYSTDALAQSLLKFDSSEIYSAFKKNIASHRSKSSRELFSVGVNNVVNNMLNSNKGIFRRVLCSILFLVMSLKINNFR